MDDNAATMAIDDVKDLISQLLAAITKVIPDSNIRAAVRRQVRQITGAAIRKTRTDPSAAVANNLHSDWHNEMNGSLDAVYRQLREDSDRAFASGNSKAARSRVADLLTWGQTFLPEHFHLPPSAMHRWLAQQLDNMRTGAASS